MKGNNEMLLNTATIMFAVQEWLNRNIIGGAVNAPQVTHVAQEGNSFRVSLKERESKK